MRRWEGGKAGRRDGGTAGRREGVWEGQCSKPAAPSCRRWSASSRSGTSCATSRPRVWLRRRQRPYAANAIP
eukprot:1454194-Prymnesium_polylepis.1